MERGVLATGPRPQDKSRSPGRMPASRAGDSGRTYDRKPSKMETKYPYIRKKNISFTYEYSVLIVGDFGRTNLKEL